MQARLQIGAVDDPLEREADRTADDVLADVPEVPRLSAASVRVDRKCAACERDDDLDATLHLKAEPAATPCASCHDDRNVHALVRNVVGSAGGSLDADTRALLEPRFGADFSGVRVHTDAIAARSAHALGASAYAFGEHVVFAEGRYRPGSGPGRRLIAHELAHVVQQRGGSGRSTLRRKPTASTPSRAKPVAQARGRVYGVQVDPRANTISFITESGTLTYKLLAPVEIPPGAYRFAIAVRGNDLTLTGEGAATKFAPFRYAIARGQPNPASLLRGQTQVGVTVLEDQAAAAAGGTPSGRPADAALASNVRFSVQRLSAEDFEALAGVSASTLKEGQFIAGNDLPDPARSASGGGDGQSRANAAWTPGAGSGMALTRFPSYPIPPNATGVIWTQMGAGHFSQFANTGGTMTARGFRYDLWMNLFPGLRETGLPGSYQNDFVFTLLPNQTIVFRESDPAGAEAFAERLLATNHDGTYRFPPRAGRDVGVCGSNCITVPADEVTAALGVRPEVLTPDGPVDVLRAGRPSEGAPFDARYAGRGTAVREWLGQDDAYFAQRGLTRSRVPAFTPAARAGVGFVKIGGGVLMIYGAYRTYDRIAKASDAERPRVVAEEEGAWVGGALGSALGAAGAGALFCLPAGPADFVCVAAGFVGGLVFGVAGGVAGQAAGGAAYDFLGDSVDEAFRNYRRAQGDAMPAGADGAIDQVLGDPFF